ncbi:hypothetical protein [Aeromonas molluscorum]|uniref:hypothetical protein n=1 Tax=Aeromonas molluscorum TaxID=271417 RepID=UPI003F1C5812
MKIKLSPVFGDEPLVARVTGDVLTVNSVALDFSPMQEGASLPAEAVGNPWVIADAVTRHAGEICLTLRLPCVPTSPYETRFPTAYNVPIAVSNGIVPLPPYKSSEEALA